VSSARRTGYRLLGGGMDYVLHLRPAEWPIMAAHTALGYLLATGVSRAGEREWLLPGLLGVGLWVVCLNGGTLAINSAYDRDEGDVAYLRSPPPPPRRLAGFSLGLMSLGLLLALALPAGYAVAYGLCFLMSLLYSVPPVRLKAVAGADWVINMWGFGTLTPYAGWAATGIPLDGARALVLLAFCPLFAALYPLTQLYQLEEDTRRGDRTLAVVLGIERSLDAALAAAALAFGLFALAGGRSGWSGAPDLWRWGAVALAAAAWLAVLVPWRLRHAAYRTADHQRGMYRALAAWAVTDVAVLLAWGT
jgi:4-hydroxybenzoate polyprenyltransferase